MRIEGGCQEFGAEAGSQRRLVPPVDDGDGVDEVIVQVTRVLDHPIVTVPPPDRHEVRHRQVLHCLTQTDPAGVQLPILEQLLPDPIGEIAIEVPGTMLVDPVTVIVLEGTDLSEGRSATESLEVAAILTPTGQ